MFHFFLNATHCTALGTFICSFLLRFFKEMHENMHVYSRVGRCCLSHSCTVRPNLPRTPERWTEKADGPSPSTFLCVSCCFCFRCFFSSLHQNHFQLACDSDRLCSVSDQEDFQATFQTMMNAHHHPVHCSEVRLFTVSKFRRIIPFLVTTIWIKKTKTTLTIRARQVCHTDSINKIELGQCITRCCYWYNPSILLWNVTMNTMHGLAWVGCVSLQRKLVS